MSAELEQFCILAKTQKGRACSALVQQVLSHKKIFVFGDLIEIPSVQGLKDTEFSVAYNSLELFAYGTYGDFKAFPDQYFELSEYQIYKLRLLTLVSLANSHRILTFSSLLNKLGLVNDRELEDLIIEAIYLGLIIGKLDQKNKKFKVISSISRDVKPSEINSLIYNFIIWKNKCTLMRKSLENDISFINKQSEIQKINQIEVQDQAEKKKCDIKAHFEAGRDLEELEISQKRKLTRSARDNIIGSFKGHLGKKVNLLNS